VGDYYTAHTYRARWYSALGLRRAKPMDSQTNVAVAIRTPNMALVQLIP